MKKLFGTLTVFVVTACALAQQQSDVRVYTQPKLPSRDVLDKLDLSIAWAARIKLDGLRDGFYSLQLFPGKTFPLLVVQTLRGDVLAINGETGDTLWRVPIGLPYNSLAPALVNSQTVAVSRKTTLFALDRDTGKHLLFTITPEGNQTDGYALEAIPSTTPSLSDETLVVCFGNYASGATVPDLRAGIKLQRKDLGTPQPYRLWTYDTFARLSQPAVERGKTVVLIADDGTVFLIDKKTGVPTATLKLSGGVGASAAAHGSMVYIPSLDYFLYALDTTTGRVLWRFSGPAPMTDDPIATDADVFVTASRGGMNRLDRMSGDLKWTNPDALTFLSVNRRFVYALDRVGNVLILDYLRGKTMAVWEARDWVLNISNDVTDRMYLASHDGQIICLRHREHVKPLQNKALEGLLSKDAEAPKKDLEKKEPEPEKKEPEKKEPEKKDVDKKEPDKKVEDKKIEDKKEPDKKDADKKDLDKKIPDKLDQGKKDVDKKDADKKEPIVKDMDKKDPDKAVKDPDKGKDNDKKFHRESELALWFMPPHQCIVQALPLWADCAPRFLTRS